jgi:hypothetical protein
MIGIPIAPFFSSVSREKQNLAKENKKRAGISPGPLYH